MAVLLLSCLAEGIIGGLCLLLIRVPDQTSFLRKESSAPVLCYSPVSSR